MLPRRSALVAFIASVTATAPVFAGEKFTTENFVVDAPSRDLARQFGEYAEQYRREKAMDWLGYEMPRWPQRCPLRVQVSMNQTGGATTFEFGPGSDGRSQVTSRKMHIFGPVDQLLKSVLPHEVTHTVLAHHFGQPVPRWADEGGSVLSENDEERYSHDIRCREILNQGHGIAVRHLFTLREYPKEMMVLYAQGYSLSQFLTDKEGGKQKFLEFVGVGMRNENRNWEQAVRMYGFESTDELQEAWIKSLMSPPQRQVAARNQVRGTKDSSSASLTSGARGSETRTSSLSSLPMLEPPVLARGAAPDRDDRPNTKSAAARPTAADPAGQPPVIKLGPPEPSRR